MRATMPGVSNTNPALKYPRHVDRFVDRWIWEEPLDTIAVFVPTTESPRKPLVFHVAEDLQKQLGWISRHLKIPADDLVEEAIVMLLERYRGVVTSRQRTLLYHEAKLNERRTTRSRKAEARARKRASKESAVPRRPADPVPGDDGQ